MKGCHDCPTAIEIAQGLHTTTAWQWLPCATCNVMSGVGFSISFNENRADKLQVKEMSGYHSQGEGSATTTVNDGEKMYPMSVLREMAKGLLSLPGPVRDSVCFRISGLQYKEIGKKMGVTTACAEKRHRRALELFPALKALFPEKIAKQSRRKPRSP